MTSLLKGRKTQTQAKTFVCFSSQLFKIKYLVFRQLRQMRRKHLFHACVMCFVSFLYQALSPLKIVWKIRGSGQIKDIKIGSCDFHCDTLHQSMAWQVCPIYNVLSSPCVCLRHRCCHCGLLTFSTLKQLHRFAKNFVWMFLVYPSTKFVKTKVLPQFFLWNFR